MQMGRRAPWTWTGNRPIDLIFKDLEDLDCENILEIKLLLISGKLNQGFTFTNRKRTLIIIGPTSNVEEFANTLDYEKGHLVTHVC